MASTPIPRDHGDFHVAIICALPLEAECVIDALDRIWRDKKYDPLVNDDSAYTLGSRSPPTWMTIFTLPSSTAANGNDAASEQTRLDNSRASWTTDQFWHVIHQAYQASLLQSISPATEVDEVSFTLHPLIRDWLQLRMRLDQRQTRIREAIGMLTSSTRVCTTGNSNAQTKAATLLHMSAVLICDDEFFDDQSRLGQEISTCDDADWFATFYRDQGHYSASLCLCRMMVTTKERVLGVEHPDTLASMNNLALVLGSQGKYREAEQIHRQVLGAMKRVLGIEHPDTLGNMSNLALVLGSQGKYSEAEQIHRQVLGARERVLGVEHPDTLASVNNLAIIPSRQDKFIEVERIQSQAARSWLTSLGPQHPNTKVIIDTLLCIWAKQDREPSEIEKLLHGLIQNANSPSG